MDFHEILCLCIVWKSVKKIQFYCNVIRMIGTLCEDLCTFMIVSCWIILRTGRFQTKVVEKIKTHSLSYLVISLFVAPSQHSGPIQSPFSEARVIWGALTPSCHAWKEIITEISNLNISSWDNLHPESHTDHGKWIYRRKYLSGRTNMSRSVKSHISYWFNGRT